MTRSVWEMADIEPTRRRSSCKHNHCVIAGRSVSKRHFDEYQAFYRWFATETSTEDFSHIERLFLRFVRDPNFQDKELRRAHAERIIKAGTGGRRWAWGVGRLLSMRCLRGAGRVEKKTRRRKLVGRREVAKALVGDEITREEFKVVSDGDEVELKGLGLGALENGGSDAMVIHDHDECDAGGDNDNNNDTEIDGPSSPSLAANQSASELKTPIRRLSPAAQLLTPDSTRLAHFCPGSDNGAQKGDLERDDDDLRRENRELRGQVVHVPAELCRSHYEKAVLEAENSAPRANDWS